MEVAKRLAAIPPYVFAELDKKRLAAQARGVDVINLGIGDPDQPTPAHIVEAMHQALANPANHKYPPFGGTKEYREGAAKWLSERFGFSCDPASEITSLIGTKEGIHNIIMAYVDPGDLVLIPDPCYPVYRSSTIMAGGSAHFMPITPENAFLPDFSAIPASIARRAKLMFLNYPNNPTAGVCGLDFFERAVDYARRHEILIVQDLAYSEMTYDGFRAHSILEVPGARDVVIELHSLSKTYNMTGWRIGFAAGCGQAVKALAQIKSNIDTDVFRATQMAAVAAFAGPRTDIERCNKLYQGRRDLAVESLHALGWKFATPKATFYLWLRTPPGLTSAQFSSQMLDRAGIVVPPGTAYGPGGEGFFRISLCVSEERLAEAFQRMKQQAITFAPGAVAV